MTNRATQVARLTALTSNSNIRVGQVARLAGVQSASYARTNQMARLTALQSASRARVSQISRLVASPPNLVSIGSFVSFASKSGSTSLSTTTTAAIQQNQIAVVVVATDNQDTTDSNTTLHSSVVIDGYNATKIREYTKGSGTIDAGATVSAWYLVAPATIASGTNITVNLSAFKSAKALSGFIFHNNTSSEIIVDGMLDQAGTASDLASMSLSGSYSQDRIWIRAIAAESDTGTTGQLTPTAGWSQLMQSSTSGTPSASNIIATGEFCFRNGTETETSDPTFANGTNTDNANILFGLVLNSSQVYDEVASGGVLTGGLNYANAVIQESSNGGVNIGFSNDTFTFIFNETASGGVEVSCKSLNLTEVELVSQGGVVVSPNNDATLITENVSSGGILLAGNNFYIISFDEFMTGGITVSCASVNYTEFVIIPNSGLLANSSSQVTSISENLATGGSIIGGESLYAFANNEQMNGGVLLDGEHIQFAILKEIMRGGCKIRGAVRISVKKTPRKAKPKFAKGEKVFVRCSKLCCHVLQKVRKIERNKNAFIYDCGIGSFTESNILSIEEFSILKGTSLGNALCVRRSE